MEEKYKMALSEVYELFKIMPEEILNKIPKKLMIIIEKERNKNYKKTIKLPLNIEDFQYETIVFLGLIYRDFLCSEEEKKKLKKQDEELLKEYNNELNKKYNPDNIFKKRNTEEKKNINNMQLIERKTSLLKKILSKILHF